jgi:hypothetical protein
MEIAMQQLEHSVAAPSDTDWLALIAEHTRSLENALNRHVEEVEAPSGLLDQVVERAPRLQRTVKRIKDDHVSLHEAVSRIQAAVAAAQTEKPDPETDDRIRDLAIALMGEMTSHRHRGANLIYDAYDIDIGGY